MPTTEAYVLNEEVERAFVGLERVAQAAGQIRERRRGALSIAGTLDLVADFLPRVIALFVREHDGVDVTLLALEPAAVVEHVGAQRCDLGFVGPSIAHPHVRLEALGQWPMRCIVPRGHRLARKRIVTAADCAGENFVSFPKLSEPRRMIDRVFAESGVTRQTIHNLFGTKTGVLEAVFDLIALESGMERMREVMMQPPGETQLARFVETFCGFWAKNRLTATSVRCPPIAAELPSM